LQSGFALDFIAKIGNMPQARSIKRNKLNPTCETIHWRPVMAKEPEDFEDEDDEDERPVKKSSKFRKGSKMESKRITAGILALLVGWLGVHKFYLGQTVPGIILLLTGGGCGIVSLIEGIIYLTKSDEDFIQTYQVEKKAWF